MSLSEQDREGQSGSTLAIEQQEISQMVKCRMSSLGHPLEDYGEMNNLCNDVVFTSIMANFACFTSFHISLICSRQCSFLHNYVCIFMPEVDLCYISDSF